MPRGARRYCSWITLLALWIAPAQSWAQTPAEVEPGSVPLGTFTSTAPAGTLSRGPEVPALEGADKAEDPGWRLYHLAFRALASRRVREAREILAQLAKAHQGHPAAARAEDLLVRLQGAPVTAPSEGGFMESTRDGAPTGFSRAELVVGQTLHGIAVGAEICVIAECDDVRAFGALMVLGGGGALALSLYFSNDGITPGHAVALNNGTIWGLFNGLMIAGLASRELDSAQALGGLLLGGQMLGLAAGEVLWRATRAGPGDFALASSFGYWSGALTMFIFAASDLDSIESQVVFGTLMATVDAGLIAGAILARYAPISRGHVAVIDGGGLLGALLGLGAAFIAQGDNARVGPTFVSASIGMVTGLGVTAYLTRNFDVPDVPVQVGFMPAPGGGGMVSVGGLW
ncbi:MAG: hypothetical protein IT384_03235 [Deltaproteobacteria bacterium]|nr:hypothetical protein [Deltaproteobacteria bacterium]